MNAEYLRHRASFEFQHKAPKLGRAFRDSSTFIFNAGLWTADTVDYYSKKLVQSS